MAVNKTYKLNRGADTNRKFGCIVYHSLHQIFIDFIVILHCIKIKACDCHCVPEQLRDEDTNRYVYVLKLYHKHEKKGRIKCQYTFFMVLFAMSCCISEM